MCAPVGLCFSKLGISLDTVIHIESKASQTNFETELKLVAYAVSNRCQVLLDWVSLKNLKCPLSSLWGASVHSLAIEDLGSLPVFL